MAAILGLDAGTSGVRAAVVDGEGAVLAQVQRSLPPTTPAPGRVEFDADALAEAVRELAAEAIARGGPVGAVGIASQRGSAVVWDPATGRAVAPGQGWQDVRTAGRCASLRAAGHPVAPHEAAPKLAAILDEMDPGRRRALCGGTVDSWLVWQLSGGALHVSDVGNARASGLWRPEAGRDEALCAALGLAPELLPRVVDSSGPLGPATRLPGAPQIAGVAGDQQASLVGQGAVRAGDAKCTFGTGAMLDVVLGPGPAPPAPGDGVFPIVAWRLPGEAGAETCHGVEALALSAGACLAWCCELGLLRDPASSAELAAACPDAAGVVFVPSLLGLGTPFWDARARGAFFGLTRGVGRGEMVRAVLEGVAHRGADLLEAAERATGIRVPELRIDGGMSANAPFAQALADASGRAVVTARVREATVLGAAFLAGIGVGLWGGLEEVAARARPARRFEPRRRLDRARWREAVARVRSPLASSGRP